MAEHKSDHATDAVVLLTGTHAESLIAALRGVNTVVVRLEQACRELTKSNNALVAEMKKGRGGRRKSDKGSSDKGTNSGHGQ